MLVITSFTFPFGIIFLLLPRNNKLDEKWYVNTIGALYADIRTQSKLTLFFNVIYIGRRIIFAGIAIIAYDYPFF